MHNGRPSLTVADLVEQHFDSLYRFAFRLSGSAADAEDLVQETYLIALERVDQLRDPENARSWLFTVLRHHYLRARRPSPATSAISLDRAPEPLEDGAEEFPVDHAELQAALDELPEEFRTPIILFYFGEFSYKQIAEQMDVPIGTVMSRLARGKGWLRKRLSACLAGAPPA